MKNKETLKEITEAHIGNLKELGQIFLQLIEKVKILKTSLCLKDKEIEDLGKEILDLKEKLHKYVYNKIKF